jgi:glycyl-tRNA synthetase beta chain
MSKETLLLEIGTEEIPARFMPSTLELLQEEACKICNDSRLTYEKIVTLGTPRRLTALIYGLGERQADLEEKKKGPALRAAYDALGEPTRAAEGFARSQGVRVQDLVAEELDGTEYIFANKKIAGKTTREILPAMLEGLLHRITFPKPMFWTVREVRFARPIRWLCALYGQDPVPFSYAGLGSGPYTYGHRFLSPGPHPVTSPEDYLKTLQSNYVMVDPVERREKIRQQAEEAAASLGGEVLMDEDLLTEVNFLVEYPLAVAGSYNPDYLRLPREVLITTMQSHQRYFPVQEKGKKQLLPSFITIANGLESYKEKVRTGNERVLRARLADADFFYREDMKAPLHEKVEALKNIVFQEDLGSLWQKTMRIQDNAVYLSSLLNLTEEEKDTAKRGAYLCKADLVTSMVYEFSELQGIMGREYALRSGEKAQVAAAVYEHYLPRYAGDEVPLSAAGAVIALADKLDNILASFSRGKEPTGSQDPYALRRQALGVIAILNAREISLDLPSLLNRAYRRLHQDAAGTLKEQKETVSRVFDFIMQRLKYILLEEGLRFDAVDAMISSRGCDLHLISRRARELASLTGNEEVLELLKAYTRVVNLAGKAPEGVSLREELFLEEEEKDLYEAFLRVKEEGGNYLSQGDFAGFLKAGAALKPAVDGFFDKVMVMVEDEKVRNNRLILLKHIRDYFLDVVDLGKIVYA